MARLQHATHFDPLIGRDFDPPKPAPDALLYIAKLWNIAVEEMVMVGDSKYDVWCGKSAGAVTVLVRHEDNMTVRGEAHWEIDGLEELIPLLKSLYSV